MPGIGDSSQAPVSTLGQPLVTPATPLVQPSSIPQMVQAIREGTLTAHDILDRVGEVGQARKKAELQSLGEFVSPDVVAARAAAVKAATAQAGATTAQATAAGQLTPPEAQLRQQQLDDAIYEQRYGEPGAVSLYRELSPNPILKADGTEDKDSMAHAGAKYLQRMKMLQWSLPMLKPDPALSKEEIINGRRVRVLKNAFGNPIPDLHDILNVYDNVDSMTPPKKGKGEEATAPVISPSVNPATKPVIDIPGMNDTNSLQDLGPAGANPQEFLDKVHLSESHKQWDAQKKNIEEVARLDERFSKKPLEKITNDDDRALVESNIKLNDPQGVIREFKWNKTTDTRPFGEAVKEAFPVLLFKEKTLTQGQRARLLQQNYELAQNLERSVAPSLKAVTELQKNWPNFPSTMTEPEQVLAAGGTGLKPLTYGQPTAPAAGMAAQIRTVPGKGQMISSDGGKTWSWVR